MQDFISILKEKPMFIGSNGATTVEIQEAEIKLSVSFSKEYKDYLSSFGFAVYEGHELTGITKDLNLDVVNVTVKNLHKNPSIKLPLYVIEEAHIDGIVVWQSPTGEIYESVPQSPPVMIANNLRDYLRLEE